MKKGIFIQSNNKQYLGAVIAKYSIERFFADGEQIPVTIINVDELGLFKRMRGKVYKMKVTAGTMQRAYTAENLQSFNFSRFMPPKLMNYEGLALVIDPDVFSLIDVREIFNFNLKGKAIAAVCRSNDHFKSSVMLLDCAKLRHWKINDILQGLMDGEVESNDLMSLVGESVTELPSEWNSFDIIRDDTKMLHTTRKITQPWRTGLPVDFMTSEEKPMPKLFGIISREWVYSLMGRKREIPIHCKPHPKKNVIKFFFILVSDALNAGVVDRAFIQKAIDDKYIRPDFLEALDRYIKTT